MDLKNPNRAHLCCLSFAKVSHNYDLILIDCARLTYFDDSSIPILVVT